MAAAAGALQPEAKRPRLHPETVGNARALDTHIWDLWMSQHQLVAVAVAIQMHVFECVEAKQDAGTLSVADLAKDLGILPRGMEALLAVLAAMGHLKLNSEGDVVGLGQDAREFFLHDSPLFWGPMLCSTMGPQQDRLIAALQESEQGERVTRAWGLASLGEERAEAIVRCMHSHSAAIAPRVADAAHPLLKEVRSLLDMGGGSGVFALELAKAHPKLHCTVADLDAVVNVLEVPHDLRDQVQLVAMDMFRDSWPLGHDVHLLSSILHDWADADCLQLLRCSHLALPPGGRVFLHEALLHGQGLPGPLTTACLSLHMFLYTEGKQRTLQELRKMLQEAGFVSIQEVPVEGTYFSLIVAKKPETTHPTDVTPTLSASSHQSR